MDKIKFIAWYQILSGCFAFIWSVIILFIGFNIYSFPVFVISFILIFYVIYSGYKILTASLTGIKLSIFAQLIQSIGFTIPGFTYKFSTISLFSVIINEHYKGLKILNAIVALNIRFDSNIDYLGIEIFPFPLIIIIILVYAGFKMEKGKLH